jgi:hypothetical protein
MRLDTAIVLGLLTAVTAWAAELPLQPYAYAEGFEKEPPAVALWASRGTPPTVATLAASTEKAFEGSRALKIDVTFGDSTYYYFGLPLRLPLAGKLRISARLWVAEGNQNNVGFGLNFAFPPTTHTGCGPIASFAKPDGTWHLIEADLVTAGRDSAEAVMGHYVRGVSGKDVGVLLDRWSLFLTGEPGKRVVAYLDDIRITGEIPVEAAYLQQVQATFDASRASFQRDVQAWEQQVAAAQPLVATAAAQAATAPKLVEAIALADQRARELLAQFRKDVYAGPAEVAQLQREIRVMQGWPRALAALQEARAAGRRFLVAPCNRVTTVFRTGDNELAALISDESALTAAACAGEFESVSAIVYGLQETAALTVVCSPLTSPGATLPATVAEVRLVKSWYQGKTTGISYTKDKWLIPELLLKDDRLVRVDLATQENYVRSTAVDGSESYRLCSGPESTNLQGVRPLDASTLQPVDVAAGDSREFWVTLHVPAAAAPGIYQGTLTFASQAGTATLPLQLTVHPFALQAPRLITSIYYRGTLADDDRPSISSEAKSEQQYRAEMTDLRDHGVLYPTNYQSRQGKLQRALEIRRECGLPGGPFYNLGYSVGPQTEAQLPELRQEVAWWLDVLKPYGYTSVYFYGIDEATGEALARQQAAWKATQECGGKTFVACYKKTFEAMGALLNTAVLAGPPDRDEAAKYHAVGAQAFCYANPQVGVEDPAVYRRNFGLVLWKAGFDGAMDYAYQHGFNHVWNDFDDKTYRDHNFTYPTINGVIPTLAWEGFREGVDDVRYATTLAAAIRTAPAARRQDAAAAAQWLDALDPANADLDACRAQMATWISRLQ